MIGCLTTVLALQYGLESGDGGLIASGSLGQWEYGVATSGPAVPAVWGTRLGGTTFNDTEEFLEVPLPDLSGLDRPVLIVEHLYDLGLGDSAYFEVDTGAGFAVMHPIYGYPDPAGFVGRGPGWVRTGLDLTGLPSATRVRLRFAADAVGTGPGWYVRTVELYDGDPVGPRISAIDAPFDTQDLTGPYAVTVKIDEDLQVITSGLSWSTSAGGATEEFVEQGAGIYTALIPGQPPNTLVEWSATATDCGASATLVGDAFRVFLAAPRDLTGPTEPHGVGVSATLSWDEPSSPHVPLEYLLEELSGGFSTSVTDTSVEVQLDPQWDQRFVVRARYADGVGDPSEVVQLDVEVPELVTVLPSAGFPGENLYVAIEGRALYLEDGVSVVTLGEHVQVQSFAVLDVDRGLARIAIEENAEPGSRDVVIEGPSGVHVFERAFEVLDGADAPRITSVTPAKVEQGSEVEIEVKASRFFAGPIAITADDDLLLGGDPIVEGDSATFRVAAVGRARPGLHDLLLDDGTRLWELQIEVTEYRLPSRSMCSAAPGVGLWALALPLLFRVSRRR